MPINLSPTALIAASCVLCSAALAEDIRLTCTGTVTSVMNGGLTTAPLAGAAVGDAVTYTIDVEVKHPTSAQGADTLYQVNWPTSSVTIGGASAGLAPSVTPGLIEFFIWNGASDTFSFQGGLASNPDAFVQLNLFDNQGLAINSWDLRDLVGTSLPLTGWTNLQFGIEESGGSLEFTLNTVDIALAPGGPLGTAYCSAVPNTTGDVGMVGAYGLDTPGDNDLTLTAFGLPASRFGYFLVSQTQGFVPGAGGSQGNLCLAGTIGRFKSELQRSDVYGQIVVPLELSAIPGPTGTTAAQAGQTWNFQLWHRDFTPATGATSNFTQAVSLTFQ